MPSRKLRPRCPGALDGQGGPDVAEVLLGRPVKLRHVRLQDLDALHGEAGVASFPLAGGACQDDTVPLRAGTPQLLVEARGLEGPMGNIAQGVSASQSSSLRPMTRENSPRL